MFYFHRKASEYIEQAVVCKINMDAAFPAVICSTANRTKTKKRTSIGYDDRINNGNVINIMSDTPCNAYIPYDIA